MLFGFLEKKRTVVIIAVIVAIVFLSAGFEVRAVEHDMETLPEEYIDFVEALPQGVSDNLPEEIFSNKQEDVLSSAKEISSPIFLLNALLSAFGARIHTVLPILALLCGIVILSSVIKLFAESMTPSFSKMTEFCIALCSYCAIAGVAVESLSHLKEFFDSMFACVASFLPISGVLYAMGGNLTAAASGSVGISVVMTVCQYLCTSTVIPMFCICLSLSLLGCVGGLASSASQSISASLKKWYSVALGFIMMILTGSIATQSIISSKADGLAMKGVKYAVAGFVPITGGSLSSTLGTLAASVELLRGSVGVIGITVIILMLIPVIVELMLMRFVCEISAFISGMLSCQGEQRLLLDIGSLYGYLEGVAFLSSVVFIIALAIFAATGAAVG